MGTSEPQHAHDSAGHVRADAATDWSRRPEPQEIAQYVTAEHFTLQTARIATTTETMGRATIFLSSLSGALLVLAFIGQVSKFGDPFPTFTVVLLAPSLFVGVATFVRVVESAIEYMIYARGMNRLRHLFLERAPELHDFFILATSDDTQGTLSNTHASPSIRQMFLTTAGMIAVINSVIAASLSGLIMATGLGLPAPLDFGGGIVVFIVVLVLQQAYQLRLWRRVERTTPVIFPSSRGEDEARL